MNDQPNPASPGAAPAAPSETTKRPRGRPAKPQPESPEARLARAEAELHAAQEAVRQAEAFRAEIVGGAVLRHAAKNPEFRRALVAVLRVEVQSRSGREAVAALLVEDSAAPAPPA